MNLNHQNILIVGLARTGAAVARFLIHRGADVTVTDSADESRLGPIVSDMRRLGVRLELGKHPSVSFQNADRIVLSPGVPHTLPEVQAARAAGVPVMGEIELASHFIHTPMIAVTGTNGKTTTATLLGHILRTAGREVFVGGNIGHPLIAYADGPQTADWIVLEISSFQLDTIQRFRPQIGILLNITDDHLDRYPDFNGYAASKGRLFMNQTAADLALVNADDPPTHALLGSLKGRCCSFNGRLASDNETSIDENGITFNVPCCKPWTLDLSGCRLRGRHNGENIAAAALAALTAGAADIRHIQAAVNDFKGLPDRIEYIASVDDVAYYNDSKATNVNAVVRALECFEQGVILIMGGRDKGGGYEALKAPLARHAKKIILMGEAAPIIQAALKDKIEIETVDTMQTAVSAARQSAEPGDTVLLSPACSSFDRYTGYHERGEDFRRQVVTAGR
jgi:UDP-N-acetylmuramoylalanine--D-glutamate ligase